jgi:hypothetical protein
MNLDAILTHILDWMQQLRIRFEIQYQTKLVTLLIM